MGGNLYCGLFDSRDARVFGQGSLRRVRILRLLRFALRSFVIHGRLLGWSLLDRGDRLRRRVFLVDGARDAVLELALSWFAGCRERNSWMFLCRSS